MSETSQHWPSPDQVLQGAQQVEAPLRVIQPGEPFPPEWEPHIAHLEPKVQQLLRDYFPHVYLQPSPWLDGRPVGTVQALAMHVEAEEKQRSKVDKEQRAAQREAQRAQQAAKAQSWLEWQEQCRQRKAWIERLNDEWKARVAQRKAASKMWDAYVEEARLQVQSARETVVPEKPA